MKKWALLILAAMCVAVWAAVGILARTQYADAADIPTLMVLPSLSPTDTQRPADTQAPSASPTPSWTQLPTESSTPTALPTLATRVLVITAVMSSVHADVAVTLPPDVTLLSAPPAPAEPLPDATDTAPPFTGWYSFESDYPSVRYSPPWMPRLSSAASRGQYHRTDREGAAEFHFEGEALRIRYIAAQNMGVFEIAVDGQVIDTIDAYADGLGSLASPVYGVGQGRHVLLIRSTGRKSDASEGYVVGLDAIQVFRSDVHTRIVPPAIVTNEPTSPPQPARRVELISAPPTLQPTWTPLAPRVVTATVLIAYDENSNRSVDPAEGVAGISVRVVQSNTNRIIASGYTDTRGYVEFQLIADTPARIVVPYFGETWELQRGSTAGAPAYTLLLTPGNQPGLIP